MQVSVEETGALKRLLTVEIPAADVDAKVDERLRELSRTIRLNGFRPGKVPYKVVVKRFGKQIQLEVEGELVQKSYGDALQQEDLKPAGMPDVKPLGERTAGDALKYSAEIEVYPTIELTGLEGVAVEKPTADISAEDVDGMLQRLREQRAEYGAVERAAGNDDQVTVDYVGSVDGEEFEGGSAENFDIVLGGGRMIPGFEEGIVGMSAGEEKVIDVTFPEDYAAENLKGKAAQFKMSCKQVAEQKLPELDEEFLKAMGVEEGGEEALRVQLKERMEKERDEIVKNRLKEQLLDGILAANSFETPDSLVAEEIKRLREQRLQQLGVQDPSQGPVLGDELFADDALKRVQLGLLVGELVKFKDVQLNNDKVEEVLRAAAGDYGDPEIMMQYYRSQENVMRNIEALALEEQVVDVLLADAQITEKAMSFSELTGLEQD